MRESNEDDGPRGKTLWWPSLDLATELNAIVLIESAQTPGSCDRARLDGVLNRPRWEFELRGTDDVVQLAAHVAQAVACGHAFVDGNKRTAYVLMVVFLLRNGYVMTLPKDDESIAKRIEAIVIAAHESDAAGRTATEFLAEHLRSVCVPHDLDLIDSP